MSLETIYIPNPTDVVAVAVKPAHVRRVTRTAYILSTALVLAVCALALQVNTIGLAQDDALPDASLASDGQAAIAQSSSTLLVSIPQTVQSTDVTTDAQSTVELVVSLQQQCGYKAIGSAWSIGNDQMITAAHVVAGAESIEAAIPDGRTLPATVVYFDKTADIAIIGVPGANLPGLSLAAAEPAAGTPVAIIGYGVVDSFQVIVPEQISPGAVQQAYGHGVWFRGDHRHGYSGGPIVDLHGRVIGMIDSGFFYPDGTPSPIGGMAIGVSNLNQVMAVAAESTANLPTPECSDEG